VRLAALLLLGACLPDLGPRSAQAHAGRCGDCHGIQAEAFAHSRHGDADGSELFLRMRAAAPEPDPCDTCHAPDGGFSCLTCHAAAGNQRTADGLLLHDPTGPVRGPTGREVAAPHASVEDAFLTDSALCGTCHQLEGDGAFHETPYTNWQRSQAAEAGTRCQDCHMSPEPGVDARRPRGPAADGAAPARLADHRFVGLQRDPVQLLRAGLTLEATSEGVRLTNQAGHALPDGAAFTRELWLEGRDPDGAWTGEVHPLHPQLLDADGQPTADPFLAARTALRALAPDEVRRVPFGAAEVCLRFRPVAASLASTFGLTLGDDLVVACVVR
jgi:hypothetical protein